MWRLIVSSSASGWYTYTVKTASATQMIWYTYSGSRERVELISHYYRCRCCCCCCSRCCLLVGWVVRLSSNGMYTLHICWFQKESKSEFVLQEMNTKMQTGNIISQYHKLNSSLFVPYIVMYTDEYEYLRRV